MSVDATAQMIDPDEQMRADFYAFLAGFLARPPSAAQLISAAALKGDETPIGRGIDALAAIAAHTGEKSAVREFNALFVGLGRGELLPYASVYLTGFLNEKPLAQLRRDMAHLGMSRADDVFEPEDNIASLFEMMAGLIGGRFGPPAALAPQRDFFARHISPWAGHFFADLEAAKGSVLYAPIGQIGRLFVDIEKEAFRLSGSPK
ncbi:TorD/DmsD family molecular chaperone [Paracoccus tegillarcae]|uniref:Molecular chaperone TorD n=1 Tax=Paracoccus tegillarcae TaxID=1529068 RepID=A0A2K9EZA9_9RHOB|nr:molecular chaperone TorD family protein [Paracoccus tegillarcae]AUH33442.1 molecular chaperone TorD [Paracoccus tegillarcae]